MSEMRAALARLVGWRGAVVAIHEAVIKAWPAWSSEDRRFLALALAGETGEVCNLVKKDWRGDGDPQHDGKIAEELADVRIYLELLALAYGMDLDAACTEIVRSKLIPRWPQAAAAAQAALGAGELECCCHRIEAANRCAACCQTEHAHCASPERH